MHARRVCCTVIELASLGHQKLIPDGVVITEQVLATTPAAEKQQHVAISNRPKIWAMPGVANQRVLIILNKRMKIFPMPEILGSK